MWPHADLLTHTHYRQREMIARADRFRLVKLARRRNQPAAPGRHRAAKDGYVATTRPAPAAC